MDKLKLTINTNSEKVVNDSDVLYDLLERVEIFEDLSDIEEQLQDAITVAEIHDDIMDSSNELHGIFIEYLMEMGYWYNPYDFNVYKTKLEEKDLEYLSPEKLKIACKAIEKFMNVHGVMRNVSMVLETENSLGVETVEVLRPVYEALVAS